MYYYIFRREQLANSKHRGKSLLKPVKQVHKRLESITKRRAQKCVSDPGIRSVILYIRYTLILCWILSYNQIVFGIFYDLNRYEF